MATRAEISPVSSSKPSPTSHRPSSRSRTISGAPRAAPRAGPIAGVAQHVSGQFPLEMEYITAAAEGKQMPAYSLGRHQRQERWPRREEQRREQGRRPPRAARRRLLDRRLCPRPERRAARPRRGARAGRRRECDRAAANRGRCSDRPRPRTHEEPAGVSSDYSRRLSSPYCFVSGFSRSSACARFSATGR